MPNFLQHIFGWYGFIGWILGIVFILGCVIAERSMKSFFSALLLSPIVVVAWPVVIYEWITGKQILLKFLLK